MGKAIGIDLGTTNSVVAFKDTSVRVITTGVNNEELCRSCLAIDRSGEKIVGNSAYRMWKLYTPNIAVSVKRLMGGSISDTNIQEMKKKDQHYPFGITKKTGGTEESVAIVLRGVEYTPEQISAEILRSLKDDASIKLGDVTHAVITVPAYFDEKQKSATVKAAQLAGLQVQRLLAEPTAAAISYGVDKMEPEESKQILVYDFGGGTFDLSILLAVDGQYVESATSGDRWLGGDTIDEILSDYICAKIEKANDFKLSDILEEKTEKEVKAFEAGLKFGVEDAKKTLSVADKATVFVSDFLEDENDDMVDDVIISRSEFENLIRPLIQKTIDLIDKLLLESSTPIETIDNILLVGGSSCIPLVKEMLIKKYGEEKVLSSEKPMLAIAEGAAILAQTLPSDNVLKPIVVIDSSDKTPKKDMIVHTTKHKFYIQLAKDDGSNYLEEIIGKQEVLPLKLNKKFNTSSKNQKIVKVVLFNDAEDNSYNLISRGFFTIADDLPKQSDLNFSFSLDLNETMNMEVKIVSSGIKKDIILARGGHDAACLREISSSIDEVLSDTSISSEKEIAFMSEIQLIIEDIEKTNYKPDDAKWEEMKNRVSSAKTKARLGDNRKEPLGKIFAEILTQVFPDFLVFGDKEDFNDKLNAAKASQDPFEKEAIYQELEEKVNQYILLIRVYIFKIISQNSQDALISAKASAIFDEAMDSLKSNDVASVRSLIDNNIGLLNEMSGPLPSPGGIGITNNNQ